MLPQQMVYRQVRHSPQRTILKQSAMLPIRYTTPIRQQRSHSQFQEYSQNSVQKFQDNLEKENEQLREKVKSLKSQLYQKEQENKDIQQNDIKGTQIDEQYIAALRVYQELKVEAEQLKLELSYVKQENNILKSKLKQINY